MLSVGRVMEQSAMTYATQPKSNEEISERKDTTLAADSTDQYVKSGAGFTPAYTKATVTENSTGQAKSGTDPDSNHEAREQAAANKKVAEKATVPQSQSVKQMMNERMKDMVRETFKQQYDKTANNNTPMSAARKELEEILKSFDEEEHEEDYWGVEKTANRILDFAKNLANGDADKFDTLKNAFEKGFSEVESYFGGKGKLPQISYDTYDKVQKGFDDWANELAGTTAVATTTS